MELGGERFQNRIEFIDSTEPVHSALLSIYYVPELNQVSRPQEALSSFTRHRSGTSPPPVEIP